MSLLHVMEVIHPYMLCYSLLFLFGYAVWAGAMYPFLRYVCRIRWFATGYSQQPKPLTTSFAIFTAAAIPLIAFAVVSKNHPAGEAIKPSVYFPQIWYDAHYWSRITRFQPQYQVFWYLYITLLFAMLLQIFFVLLHKADLPGLDVVEPAPDNHAFIIVAHNSSDILEESLVAILKLVRPFQIYIADNGSTPDEVRLTDELCKRLSDTYYSRYPMRRPIDHTSRSSDIQIAHMPVGNKTLAQYATIHFLTKELRAGRCSVNRVTIIDDDVIVPPYWSSYRCDELMDVSKGTVALGYPLSASNANETCCAGLQNLEYLGGNIARFTQDKLGTQLWASGAIATWTIEALEQILERHCTVFNGEDLEMGYLLHTLSGLGDDKLITPGPYRIGWYQECLVPTAVPPCVIHWYDWIPVQYKKKYNLGCKCGEHSFFNQRLRSWDPASHQYLVKFLHIVFSRGAYSYRAKTFVRLLCSWKLFNLAREYALFITIIISFSRVRSGGDAAVLFAFYTDTLIIGWALYATVFMLTSFSLWRVRQALPSDFCLAYPLIYDFPYVMLVRLVVVIYTFFYYLFAKPFPKPIREQMKTNEHLHHILTTAWEPKQQMVSLNINDYRTPSIHEEMAIEGCISPSERNDCYRASNSDYDSVVLMRSNDLDSTSVLAARNTNSDEEYYGSPFSDLANERLTKSWNKKIVNPYNGNGGSAPVENPFEPEMTERTIATSPAVTAATVSTLKRKAILESAVTGGLDSGNVYLQSVSRSEYLDTSKGEGVISDASTSMCQNAPIGVVGGANTAAAERTAIPVNHPKEETEPPAQPVHHSTSPTAPLLRPARSTESLSSSKVTIDSSSYENWTNIA